jgi:hypothetical protein
MCSCRVLEADPLLRMGASVNCTIYLQTLFLTFTVN